MIWWTAGTSAWRNPARCNAVYLPRGGNVTVKLGAGKYKAHWFNPRTGEKKPLPTAEGESWTSPKSPGTDDWALLLRAE